MFSSRCFSFSLLINISFPPILVYYTLLHLTCLSNFNYSSPQPHFNAFYFSCYLITRFLLMAYYCIPKCSTITVCLFMFQFVDFNLIFLCLQVSCKDSDLLTGDSLSELNDKPLPPLTILTLTAVIAHNKRTSNNEIISVSGLVHSKFPLDGAPLQRPFQQQFCGWLYFFNIYLQLS